ncbi:MAG: hypothetical protein AB8F78_03930 [Saprospiraceae bacterium]
MLFIRTFISVLLLSLGAAACLGQYNYERMELGTPDKQVYLNATLSLPNGITILYGASTMTAPHMQATAIAIDENGDELWRYGYGQPDNDGHCEFFEAIAYNGGIRLFVENPQYYSEPLDLEYVDIDLSGNPIDTNTYQLTDITYGVPSSIHKIDSTNYLYLFTYNNNLRLVGIDESGVESYNIEQTFDNTFPSGFNLLKLEDGFGVLHNEGVHFIDFDNESLHQIYSVGTLFNGLPNDHLVPVFQGNEKIAKGLLRNRGASYCELNKNGSFAYVQYLQNPIESPTASCALVSDSILHIGHRDNSEVTYTSFDLTNNGDNILKNTIVKPENIAIIFPELEFLLLDNKPTVLQQSYKKGDFYSLENNLIDITNLDTVHSFQDYRDSTFFNPEEYDLVGDLLVIRNNLQNINSPLPSFLAYNNQTLQQKFTIHTEGFPNFYDALRIEEKRQHLIALTAVYDQTDPTRAVPRFLYTEAHCFDTLGNVVWNHVADGLTTGRPFFPVADGYVWKEQNSSQLDSSKITSVDGMTGQKNWTLSVSTLNNRYVSLKGVETSGDTTFLLLQSAIIDSTYNTVSSSGIIKAIDISGNTLWELEPLAPATYVNVSNISSVVKDSVDILCYMSNPSSTNPSSGSTTWIRVAKTDSGQRILYENFNSIGQSALNGTGYTFLDYQRIVFFNRLQGRFRDVSLFDLRDSSVTEIISPTARDTNFDRYYSIEKNRNRIFVKGVTERHGLGLAVLHTISFTPRTPPAFQAPISGPVLRTTDQEIEVLGNPVKDNLQFLTKEEIDLESVELYSFSGQRVTDIQITQFSTGVYQLDFTTRPLPGIYVLSIGDASTQVMIR